MPSETVSRSEWHYEFPIAIQLHIPAISKKRNFLAHPACDASEVARLVAEGRTRAEIRSARSQGACTSRQN